MHKHTPGPWTPRKWNNGDYVVGTLNNNNKETAIAVGLIPSTFSNSSQERHANATLIACAPDMIEAIELTITDLQMRADEIEGESVVNLSHFVYLRLLTIRDKANGTVSDEK